MNIFSFKTKAWLFLLVLPVFAFALPKKALADPWGFIGVTTSTEIPDGGGGWTSDGVQDTEVLIYPISGPAECLTQPILQRYVYISTGTIATRYVTAVKTSTADYGTTNYSANKAFKYNKNALGSLGEMDWSAVDTWGAPDVLMWHVSGRGWATFAPIKHNAYDPYVGTPFLSSIRQSGLAATNTAPRFLFNTNCSFRVKMRTKTILTGQTTEWPPQKQIIDTYNFNQANCNSAHPSHDLFATDCARFNDGANADRTYSNGLNGYKDYSIAYLNSTDGSLAATLYADGDGLGGGSAAVKRLWDLGAATTVETAYRYTTVAAKISGYIDRLKFVPSTTSSTLGSNVGEPVEIRKAGTPVTNYPAVPLVEGDYTFKLKFKLNCETNQRSNGLICAHQTVARDLLVQPGNNYLGFAPTGEPTRNLASIASLPAANLVGNQFPSRFPADGYNNTSTSSYNFNLPLYFNDNAGKPGNSGDSFSSDPTAQDSTFVPPPSSGTTVSDVLVDRCEFADTNIPEVKCRGYTHTIAENLIYNGINTVPVAEFGGASFQVTYTSSPLNSSSPAHFRVNMASGNSNWYDPDTDDDSLCDVLNKPWTCWGAGGDVIEITTPLIHIGPAAGGKRWFSLVGDHTQDVAKDNFNEGPWKSYFAYIQVNVQSPAYSCSVSDGEAPHTAVITTNNFDPVALNWDFGDGTPTAFGTSPQKHTYKAAGSYTVTVTDPNILPPNSATCKIIVTMPRSGAQKEVAP